MNKVRQGTPIHNGPSLCRSCRNATIVIGTRIDEDLVVCGNLPAPYDRVRFKVIECSSYDDKSRPSLGAMSSIAWELCTDKSGRRIGFLSPRDMKKRHEDIDDVPYVGDEPEVIRHNRG